MHGMMGQPPESAASTAATSRVMLILLVAMTGVAPISLYLLVPALPKLATTFGRDIAIAQMTVSLYMVGIACSQLIMGPLSDKFGRRPVLLAGQEGKITGYGGAAPSQVVNLLTTQEAHNLTAPPTRTWLIHYTVWMSVPVEDEG